MRGKSFLIVLIVILLMLTSGCGTKQQQNNYSLKVLETDTLIKSLQTGNGISGSYAGGFVMGVGYIDTNVYYYVYVNAGNNRYILKKLDAETTYIEETDNTPKLVEKVKYFIINNNSKNFTVNGRKAEEKSGLFYKEYIINGVIFTGKDSFNDNYDFVAQRIKLNKNQSLYVSLDKETILYVPKGTVKVQFSTDIYHGK